MSTLTLHFLHPHMRAHYARTFRVILLLCQVPLLSIATSPLAALSPGAQRRQIHGTWATRSSLARSGHCYRKNGSGWTLTAATTCKSATTGCAISASGSMRCHPLTKLPFVTPLRSSNRKESQRARQKECQSVVPRGHNRDVSSLSGLSSSRSACQMRNGRVSCQWPMKRRSGG